MAVDSNAVKKTLLASESAIPLIYDEERINALYDAEIIRQLATDKSAMLRGAGNTFNVYTRTRFTTPTTPLSDGATIAITGVAHTPTQITIAYYGDAKQFTDQAMYEGFDFIFNDWTMDAASAIGELRNYIGMAELVSGAGATYYPYKSAGVHYVTGDVDSDAVLQFEQMRDVVDAMRLARHTCKYAVIDTRQETQLMADSRFVSIDYVASGVVPNGAVGKAFGITFIVSNAVTTSTENTDKLVANAIFLSDKKDTFIFAEKVAPVFRFGRAAANELFQTWAYYTSFGFKVVDSNGVAVVKSVIGTV